MFSISFKIKDLYNQFIRQMCLELNRLQILLSNRDPRTTL